MEGKVVDIAQRYEKKENTEDGGFLDLAQVYSSSQNGKKGTKDGEIIPENTECSFPE